MSQDLALCRLFVKALFLCVRRNRFRFYGRLILFSVRQYCIHAPDYHLLPLFRDKVNIACDIRRPSHSA